MATVDRRLRGYADLNWLVKKHLYSHFENPIRQIYAQSRLLQSGDGEDMPHEVCVLRGGYQNFQAKFRDDPELDENWDKDVWGAGWAM